MVRIVVAIGSLLAARGIARADRPWDHGSPTDVDERDGWEVGADLLGSVDTGGVEVEGALRHDGVLAHVARVAWIEEPIDNDSLFVNRYGALSFAERACAWGVLCGELGMGGDVGWVHVKGSESTTTGGLFASARAMVRLPVGPAFFGFGIDAQAGGVQRDTDRGLPRPRDPLVIARSATSRRGSARARRTAARRDRRRRR
jgi:hypothetical protein